MRSGATVWSAHPESGGTVSFEEVFVAEVSVDERRLLKTMRWYDGFVIGLANPGFLIVGIGFSVGALGAKVAAILWFVSALVGALQAYVYSEPAAMFPDKPGGLAMYAKEGWRKYFSLAGPIATFGYWFAWSSVLAIYGGLIGYLLVGEFFTSLNSKGVNTDSIGGWTANVAGVDFTTVRVIGLICILLCWSFNVRGMRPAVWIGYITGALLMIPLAVLMFLPYITGDWHSSNLHNNISANASALGTSSATLVVVWLYAMCWSSYGMECCATFAPEYHDTARDTPKALRVAAIFGVMVYCLLPLGAMGTFGDQNLVFSATENNTISFYANAFDDILGAGTGVAIILLCAGIVLAMNTATADGSRALYGISQDGMTIKWLGKLNSKHVPANAMTLDALLNIFLLFTFASDAVGALKILVLSNLGYVFCHVMAMSGFVLLRRNL